MTPHQQTDIAELRVHPSKLYIHDKRSFRHNVANWGLPLQAKTYLSQVKASHGGSILSGIPHLYFQSMAHLTMICWGYVLSDGG